MRMRTHRDAHVVKEDFQPFQIQPIKCPLQNSEFQLVCCRLHDYGVCLLNKYYCQAQEVSTSTLENNYFVTSDKVITLTVFQV